MLEWQLVQPPYESRSVSSEKISIRLIGVIKNPGDKKKGEGRQAFPEDLPSIYLRLGKLNKTLTVDLGKASNFPDVPLLRPPTTPTVVHVSRPDEFLYEAGYGSNHSVVRNGVIGVTQPRCIDVLATARRVAFELGLHLGKEVGFQVRHDKRIGDNCSIKFMTVVSNAHALWTEYEMINDDESEYDAEMSDDNIPTHSLVSRNKMDNTMNSLLDIFECSGQGNSDKKCWASFQQCIAKAPEQVLRYCRNASAKPLWPMASGQPSKADIPNCSYCGGPSDFEFQILPQLLYYFGVKNDADSLDWATIVLYTCKSSCEASMAYKEEFPWVQLYPTSAT
ncbi:hypothetical protein NC652_036579 [Populus alba x Populus x berolinensis]|nr:hypothetical protein NC652_036579 [Populus alba x Populus x berolinensis]